MKFAGLVCAAAALIVTSAAAQDGGKAIPNTAIQKTTIRLGTATPGGGFPLYGNAFAEIMNAADPTLVIEPRNTKGSNENIPLPASWISGWWPASRPTRPSWASAGRGPT
jgi:uncharacterized protein